MTESTLQLVIQGGALGVLVLVLLGLFVLARLFVTPAREFLAGLVAELKANTKALTDLSGEVKSGFAKIGERVDQVEDAVGVRARLSEIKDELRAGTSTGQFAAIAPDREAPTAPMKPVRGRAASSPGR